MSIFRALLSYNSHTIQYTHLKYKIQWILICPQSSAAITTINFKTFLLPLKNPVSAVTHQLLPTSLYLKLLAAMNLHFDL